MEKLRSCSHFLSSANFLLCGTESAYNRPIFRIQKKVCSKMDQLLDFFISNAYAAQDATTAPAASGGYSFAIMIVLIFVFMYFTILRPQSKRAKEQQVLINSLSKGDEVITAGGLLGRITKVTDQYISLSLTNNVEILLQKSAIVSLLPKGTLKSLE